MKTWWSPCLIALCTLSALSAQAGQTPAAVALDAALAGEDLEIIHAKARADGGVEIIFGPGVNDADQMRVVERLRADPRVREVEASGSPRTFCRIE